ncbi:MAG: purine-binding chemotaxis protein CheW [Betaproteobacteria bacterium]|nr:purine-binding chemotaxis protein CheW [Betaproteobacteria bacterium]
MSVDWKEVRRRLTIAEAAIEGGWTPAPEEAKRILKERARALAREPERAEATGGSIEILEFRLAYENYGVESGFVQEVAPLKEFTPVPGTPPFILGIVNLRGRILSVVDLRPFFELPAKGLGDLNKVIVLHDGNLEFGILADAVAGVRSLALAAIQPSLPTLTGIREQYLKGVTPDRLVVLDGGKLLSDPNLIVREEPTP